MLDLPVRPTLQERQVAPVGVECEPAALAARLRYFLVGVANGLEVELPMFMRLIGKLLRLAGDSVDLTPRGADLVDDALVSIAP